MKTREKKSLLLIEDDAVFAETLDISLRTENYSVTHATKVSDAIWKLRNQKFDGVLLDVNLEHGGSGEDILMQIRNNGKECNYATPVIIISGFLSKALIVRLGPIAKVSILVKPFSPKQLLAKIQAALTGDFAPKSNPRDRQDDKNTSCNQEELNFLHDLSSPLGAVVFLLDALADEKPDLIQLEPIKTSLNTSLEMLSARKALLDKGGS